MPKNARRFTDDTNGGKRTARGVGDVRRLKFDEMRFVRLELTEADKEEFRTLLAAEEFHWDFLDRLVREGYKISVGADERGKGVLVSIRAETSDLLNAGLILTGRGKNVFTAVAACEFKHDYLADENGWLEAETRRGGSYDDVG